EKLALFTQIFDIEEAAFPDGEKQDERQPVHAFKRQNQQGLTSIASE
ncbi:glutamyl-tRNA reductase, partial [Bacillus paralicheniformis]|nr:glutamyl-tRNA reductase [Bacillus paralicheniformis]